MGRLLLIAFLFGSCASPTQRALERLSLESVTPIPSSPPYNDYVRCGLLPDGTETGVIQLADGSTSRYWFRSHGIAGDSLGGTLFKLSDGSTLFMAGYFCCEVQLPQKQLASLDELRSFVREHDGLPP